jgi:hypothetical protein
MTLFPVIAGFNHHHDLGEPLRDDLWAKRDGRQIA